MGFSYKLNELHCDGISVKKIAKKYGTPLYLYSYDELKKNFNAYKDALKDIPNIICFALKTSSNIGIAHELAKLGAGVDIVSGGELFRAKKAGFPREKIVFAGVGKKKEEIEYALKSNILMFNVESLSELSSLDKCASKLKKKCRVSLRINPDVNPKTHPYIATGLAESKFGISIKNARKAYQYANGLKFIESVGIHMHIGSQILQVTPFVEAAEKLVKLVHSLKNDGIFLKYFDIGGGLGISYKGEKAPKPASLVKRIEPLLKKENMTLVLEPGRSISGSAGMLITNVIYNKSSIKKDFVIIDAGMNDLARPSLYDAYHEIIPVKKNKRQKKVADIVGPICESGDYLAKNRIISHVHEGEYLAVKDVGAYAFSMSSNYNSRVKAAEVIVKKKKDYLVRRREIYNDLIRGERII